MYLPFRIRPEHAALLSLFFCVLDLYITITNNKQWSISQKILKIMVVKVNTLIFNNGFIDLHANFGKM